MKFPSRTLIINAAFLATLVVTFFLQGYMGRDFGTHWDESQHVNSTINSVKTGTFLPQMYNYPSFCYWLVASQVLPDVSITIIKMAGSDINIEGPAVKVPEMSFSKDLTEEQLLIRTRVLCLALVSLSLLWTYLLVLVWRQNQGEALLAAALLGGSFELAYHARWIAPDAILMQFVVLLTLLVFYALRYVGSRTVWLLTAAIVFGLACATKYTAGIFLLPLLLTTILGFGEGKGKALVNVFLVMVVAAVTFLLITPGAYLQPIYFFYEILKQKTIYSSGYYGGTVEGVYQHLVLSSEYFVMALFSKYKIISALFFTFALVGFIRMLFVDKRRTIFFILAPFIYYCYFIMQNLMVVRNFLVLFPFFCVFSAIGVFCVRDFFKNKHMNILVLVVVLCFVITNYAGLFFAAASIGERKSADLHRYVAVFLRDHPDKKYYLSPVLRQIFQNKAIVSNIAESINDADGYLFLNTEYDGLTRMNLKANVHDRYEVVAGAQDVNINYYPAWVEAKVLKVAIPTALDMKLL